MNRWLALVVALVAVVLLAAGGWLGYRWVFHTDPAPVAPEYVDRGEKLPTQKEFDERAKTDPIKALEAGLTRYQREVPGGLRCVVEKQERIQGYPKHPELPTVEVLELCVRGDVPDPKTKQTAIEVLVTWREGAKSFLRADIVGTLFSERPEPEGLGGKAVTWRPKALISPLSNPIPPNSELARGQSRYCIRDAGLYRTMLRTHEAWKARQDAGEFKYEYLGTKVVEKAGNRECHVIRRLCPRVELDAFELGGTASTDPKVVAEEGFTEVTIYLDRERWFQVATETYRTEPDGTRVLVGSYYFREVELNPTFAPDTFTKGNLKKSGR
ncbi:MAG TPA: DUF1571 domain-containing protein [Gemmata sp.]